MGRLVFMCLYKYSAPPRLVFGFLPRESDDEDAPPFAQHHPLAAGGWGGSWKGLAKLVATPNPPILVTNQRVALMFPQGAGPSFTMRPRWIPPCRGERRF